mmetsp:Transcript_32088/g.84002  ORF Transcript_32088/g.84002 Transcript_32088/m.84002 type:complete len:352 (-) Transcript_32088:1338-2393(-)
MAGDGKLGSVEELRSTVIGRCSGEEASTSPSSIVDTSAHRTALASLSPRDACWDRPAAGHAGGASPFERVEVLLATRASQLRSSEAAADEACAVAVRERRARRLASLRRVARVAAGVLAAAAVARAAVQTCPATMSCMKGVDGHLPYNGANIRRSYRSEGHSLRYVPNGAAVEARGITRSKPSRLRPPLEPPLAPPVVRPIWHVLTRIAPNLSAGLAAGCVAADGSEAESSHTTASDERRRESRSKRSTCQRRARCALALTAGASRSAEGADGDGGGELGGKARGGSAPWDPAGLPFALTALTPRAGCASDHEAYARRRWGDSASIASSSSVPCGEPVRSRQSASSTNVAF